MTISLEKAAQPASNQARSLDCDFIVRCRHGKREAPRALALGERGDGRNVPGAVVLRKGRCGNEQEQGERRDMSQRRYLACIDSVLSRQGESSVNSVIGLEPTTSVPRLRTTGEWLLGLDSRRERRAKARGSKPGTQAEVHFRLCFHGRGGDDVVTSHDLEDIIAVVDGRPEIVDDVAASSDDVRGYVGDEIRALLANRDFTEALAGYLLPDPASQARRSLLEGRLRLLSLR